MNKSAKDFIYFILPLITLGILVYFFLPNPHVASNSSLMVTCEANMRLISKALQMYENDYNCYPPYDGAKGLDLLRKYGDLKDSRFFICPLTKNIPAKEGVPLSEENVSYIYKGGLSYSKCYDWVLMDRSKNHNDKSVNVLFCDNYVKRFSSKWEMEIKDHIKLLKEKTLMSASYSGDIVSVKKLIEDGVNFNMQLDNGVISRLARVDNYDMMKFLIQRKFDINKPDENGKTALHWAAMKGNVQIVDLLLENKADKSILTPNKKTAFELALQENHKDTAEKLK